MPLQRYADWHRRLHEAVQRLAGRPWFYGRHDCCLAACDLIRAMTGEDPARDLRRYRSERGAYRQAMRHGGVEALAVDVARRFDAPEVDPRFAQRGDVCVVYGDYGGLYGWTEALGVVDLSGRFVLVAAQPGGWAHVPIVQARRAWRIG